MAKPAKQRYSDGERAETDWFFQFTEPARLRILRALVAGPKMMRQLVKECRIPSSSIGVHINKLERAGIVTSVMDVLNRRCTLTKDAKVTKDAIEFTHASGCKAVVPLG